MQKVEISIDLVQRIVQHIASRFNNDITAAGLVAEIQQATAEAEKQSKGGEQS
jgi:hypothetical protein